MRVRIATRASPLARWQADHVAGLLRSADPDLDVEVVALSTEGDRRTDVPLSEIGGKGVFATEVQAALLDGRADVAVHSAKDLPARTPDGLVIAAVPERGDVRDALVGCRVHVKRDDMTGGAEAGNKLRKLEYFLADAQANGATTLVTCGALQSNHARATALVGARFGLGALLLLRCTDGPTDPWTDAVDIPVLGNGKIDYGATLELARSRRSLL